jgi:hypothetical protein
MNQSTGNSKPDWLNNFDVWLVEATAIVSGLISLLDFLGLLDGIPWLAERISTLTLLAVGLIAGYLVLERRNQLDSMQRGTEHHIKALSRSLSRSTSTIIDSLEGVELKRFESGNEMMPYINERLLQACKQVDDLSWSPAVGLEYSLDTTQRLAAEYTERVSQVSQKVLYREVFSFNRPGRIERLKRRLRENAPGYSCAYYEDIQTPVLQFMIIDNEEVFILSDQMQSKMAIRHPYIVKLFAEYYEVIWKNATPIKTGTTTEEKLVQGILNKFEVTQESSAMGS